MTEETKLESHSNLEDEKEKHSSRRFYSEEEDYSSSSSSKSLKIKRKTTTTPINELNIINNNRLPLRNLNDNNNKIAGSFKDCATMKEKFRAAGTWVRTVGATVVEPEFLGPCEPGTSIVLEGVVWNETKNGVLVVNVTWRGKSYIGTLIDCSKSEWSTPRFCDSPNAQDDVSNRGNGGGGSGRKLKRNNNSHLNLNFAAPSIKSPAIDSPVNVNKNDDFVEKSPNRAAILEPSSPSLTPCTVARCGKKFTSPVALIYHQSGAHPDVAVADFRDAATSTRGDLSTRVDVDVQTTTTTENVTPENIVDGKKNSVDGKKTLSDRENASLENLFKIVSPDVSNISASPPQPSKKRRPPSPAFSDVSDADEAPTLERHLLSSPPPPQHEMKTPPKKKKEPQPETSSFLAAPLLPYDAIFVAQPPTFFAPPQPLPSKKNEKTQDAANVKSPPVQRHLHTHHHTHAYPALLTSAAAAVDPYAALLAAGQQAAAAAAAGIVGAYPPYVPK